MVMKEFISGVKKRPLVLLVLFFKFPIGIESILLYLLNLFPFDIVTPLQKNLGWSTYAYLDRKIKIMYTRPKTDEQLQL